MNDTAISAGRTAAAALWVLAAMLLNAAWLVKMFGPWEVAVMLGFTTAMTGIIAGVAQCRLYTMRVCKLMCATAGLRPVDGADIHAIH